MRTYRGYYIDGAIFTSKTDIDNFLRDQAVKSYKMAVELFANDMSLEKSIYADEKAENLVNNFGFTWEEVEAIEVSTLQNIA